MYIILVSVVHKLKCETSLVILSTSGPTYTFRNGDVLGSISESLPHAPRF